MRERFLRISPTLSEISCNYLWGQNIFKKAETIWRISPYIPNEETKNPI